MKYIKKVELENFQSHKNTEFNLEQGLNVIVGPSDSGKTAVIRALKWALYNEPSGDFFIREGEKDCSVTVEFSDGTLIQRYRTRSKNGYLLIDSYGEELRLEGIGSGVPEEIQAATGISKISLDSESDAAINLGEQLEGPFLLSEKTATRANAIGRLVGVNLLDDALREVLRDTRNLNLIRKDTGEQLADLEKEIAEYDYLDDLVERNEKVSLIISEIESQELLKEKLIKLSMSFSKLSDEILIQKNTLTKLNGIDDLELNTEILKNHLTNFRNLSAKQGNIREISDDKKLTIATLERLESIDVVTNDISQSEQLNLQINRLTKINKDYIDVITESDKLSETLLKLKGTEEGIDTVYQLEQVTKNYIHLQRLNDEYKRNSNSIQIGQEFMNRIDDAVSTSGDIAKIGEYINKYDKLRKLNSSLYTLTEENTKLDKEVENITISHEKILNKYAELLMEIGKCPYCYSDISNSTIEQLINNHLGGH
ncbi:MAG: AAA family ATPase [Gudongella sp.]|jgi:DNA repair exonuclease SbcCD ATPase subunit|nr:AAA family ATPase [Gudongella sp.]